MPRFGVDPAGTLASLRASSHGFVAEDLDVRALPRVHRCDSTSDITWLWKVGRVQEGGGELASRRDRVRVASLPDPHP